MSTQEYIRSITETIPDEFPTLTPLPEVRATSTSSTSSFFTNISWQTWIIIVLVLALLGINIFVYLAKGTQATASIFGKIFGPILKIFGYSTLETTKQTVTTTATGTKAGVDVVANTTTGAINTVQQTALASQQNGVASQQNNLPVSTSGTSVGVSTTNNTNNNTTNVQGQMATSSLPAQQQAGTNVNQWRAEQQDSLEKALSSASQSSNSNTSDPSPDDSRSVIQSSGKSGWCFIGEDQGIRTCSEIGVNDACMSGDVFPNQAICMNPNLRA